MHTTQRIRQAEDCGTVVRPDAEDIARYGRLGWIVARLRHLDAQVCDRHRSTISAFELYAGPELLDELYADSVRLGICGRSNGHQYHGMFLPDGHGGDVFVSLLRAAKRDLAGDRDAYQLWPLVRGCSTDCPNLPERGVHGLCLPSGCDLGGDALEIRWALQLADGMSADHACDAARILAA